jgi:23S rRNA pseudouridine1911/1915/1917 synthase
MCARRVEKKDLSAALNIFSFSIKEDDLPIRLDRYLAEKMPWRSRTFFQTMIEKGDVTVNGYQRRASRSLNLNDRIVVDVTKYQQEHSPVTDIPLDIVYEDDSLLVINKQQGMIVHPTGPHLYDTIMNAVHERYKNAVYAPQSVHRLDKHTSGNLIIALKDTVRRHLGTEIERRNVDKIYLALVHGMFEKRNGEITLPLTSCAYSHIRLKQWIDQKNGLHAQTFYSVLASAPNVPGILNGASLVKIKIITGRTHQIRVHMAATGHPLIGDLLYGHGNEMCADEKITSHMLHAWKTELQPSLESDRILFTAPPPQIFMRCIEKLFGASIVAHILQQEKHENLPRRGNS